LTTKEFKKKKKKNKEQEKERIRKRLSAGQCFRRHFKPRYFAEIAIFCSIFWNTQDAEKLIIPLQSLDFMSEFW